MNTLVANSKISSSRLVAIALLVSAIHLAGCSSDPRYAFPAEDLRAGGQDADPDVIPSAVFNIPIRLESASEAEERQSDAARLGIEVPFVRRDDMDLSLEWSIENLEDSQATARIFVNGANQYFSYVPLNFVVDPEDEPTPPPLIGDIPLLIPAMGTISGVFREDQFLEAATDLDLITRGGLNPFAAMLEVHEDLAEIEVMGAENIPQSAIAGLVQLDIGLQSNRMVRMSYSLRMRSHRSPNLIHDRSSEAPEGELSTFAPVEFVPPPLPEE